MQLRLIEPATRNWLLMAEGLNDPEGWNRFVPCHTHDSQRFLFEATIRRIDAPEVKLTVCKDLLSQGVSAFEFSWETNEEALLEYAMEIAELLQVDLLIGQEIPIEPTSKSAA